MLEKLENKFFIKAKSSDLEQKVQNSVKRIPKIAIFPQYKKKYVIIKWMRGKKVFYYSKKFRPRAKSAK